MNRRIVLQVISGVGLIVGLVSAGGVAYADTTFTTYSAVMPRLQQPWTSPQTQTNQSLSVSGDINVKTVGSNYKVNARLCYPNGSGCGEEAEGIGPGQHAYLPTAGLLVTKVSFQLHQNPWALVDVASTGNWRAN